ncbi:MAG: FKBP-type peptidyl-prolyl cis-trans isomerase [Nitrososphaerales archaeon]
MALEKGSLVLMNYTAKVKDTDEIIATTVEDDAKKFNVHDPTKKYEPILVSVGEGERFGIVKGVDEALLNAEIGANLTVDVSPEKGFGERDPGKVRMIPLRKLGDKADEVNIGDAIEIDDKVGIVRYIGSGRVQLDYNHRLAGRTLSYSLQVVKKLEQDTEKITALMKRRIPVEENKLKLTLNEGNLEIELPNESYMLEGLQIIKRAIVNDVFKYVNDIKKVKFFETYEPQAQT